MKNRIMNKLRSESGASITFALLLFLVCAVLCSVILAAATAASGRVKRLPETDQRYYAVTSAAELLMDDFEKYPTVSIAEVVKTPYTTEYINGVAGEPQASISEIQTNTYLIVNKKASEIVNVEGEGSIISIDSMTNTIQQDAAKNVYFGSTLTNRKLSLTSSNSGMDNILAVSISENLDGNGNLELTLYNANNYKGTASSNYERYTITLCFGLDKSTTVRTKTENVSSESVGETKFKVTTNETKITITTMTWTLNGIKTKF